MVYWGQESLVQDLDVKPKENRPLGKPRHRWEDNTKMNSLGT